MMQFDEIAAFRRQMEGSDSVCFRENPIPDSREQEKHDKRKRQEFV